MLNSKYRYLLLLILLRLISASISASSEINLIDYQHIGNSNFTFVAIPSGESLKSCQLSNTRDGTLYFPRICSALICPVNSTLHSVHALNQSNNSVRVAYSSTDESLINQWIPMNQLRDSLPGEMMILKSPSCSSVDSCYISVCAPSLLATTYLFEINPVCTLLAKHEVLPETIYMLPSPPDYGCSLGHCNYGGRMHCYSCDKGQGSDGGNCHCQSCQPGFHNDVKGNPCEPCPVGEISKGHGWHNCISCPPGQSSSSGSSSCSDCGAGSYSDSWGSACLPCQEGYHQPNSGQTGCIPCEPGMQAWGEWWHYCQPCFPGEISGSGASSCSPCGSGSYPNSQSTECISCSAGYYQPYSNQTECLSCGAGTFSANEGASYCDNCPAGQSSSDGASSCYQCGPGTFAPGNGSSCLPCPAGSYQPNSGQSECIPCSPGTEAPNAGSQQCESCQAGTYASSSGSESCSDCPPSTYSNLVGSTTVSNCQSCPIGFFTGQGVSSESQCYFCSGAGFLSSNSTVCYWLSSCTEFVPSAENSYYGTGELIFQQAWEWSDSGWSLNQTKNVPVLQFMPDFVNNLKQACEDTAPNGFNYVCTKAIYLGSEYAYFNPEHYPSYAPPSSEYPNGYIYYSTGLPMFEMAPSAGSACGNTHSYSIKPTPGYYYPNRTSQSLGEVYECPAGYWCPGGTPPLPCPSGSYQSFIGETNGSSCIPCPVGYYQDQQASASCISCDTGYCYQTASTSSTDSPCQEGYYCPSNVSDTTQYECPIGFYCPSGVSAPIPCNNNMYCPNKLMSSALSCSVFSFTPSELPYHVSGFSGITVSATPNGQLWSDYLGNDENRPEDIKVHSGWSSCIPIAPGTQVTHTIVDGKTYYSVEPCYMNKYSNISNDFTCQDCSTGYFANQDHTSCIKCPASPEDSKDLIKNALCPCGFYYSDNTCTPASPGYYVPSPVCNSGNTSTVQLPCPEGFYTSESGSSYCLKCNEGHCSKTASISASDDFVYSGHELSQALQLPMNGSVELDMILRDDEVATVHHTSHTTFYRSSRTFNLSAEHYFKEEYHIILHESHRTGDVVFIDAKPYKLVRVKDHSPEHHVKRFLYTSQLDVDDLYSMMNIHSEYSQLRPASSVSYNSSTDGTECLSTIFDSVKEIENVVTVGRTIQGIYKGVKGLAGNLKSTASESDSSSTDDTKGLLGKWKKATAAINKTTGKAAKVLKTSSNIMKVFSSPTNLLEKLQNVTSVHPEGKQCVRVKAHNSFTAGFDLIYELGRIEHMLVSHAGTSNLDVFLPGSINYTSPVTIFFADNALDQGVPIPLLPGISLHVGPYIGFALDNLTLASDTPDQYVFNISRRISHTIQASKDSGEPTSSGTKLSDELAHAYSGISNFSLFNFGLSNIYGVQFSLSILGGLFSENFNIYYEPTIAGSFDADNEFICPYPNALYGGFTKEDNFYLQLAKPQIVHIPVGEAHTWNWVLSDHATEDTCLFAPDIVWKPGEFDEHSLIIMDVDTSDPSKVNLQYNVPADEPFSKIDVSVKYFIDSTEYYPKNVNATNGFFAPFYNSLLDAGSSGNKYVGLIRDYAANVSFTLEIKTKVTSSDTVSSDPYADMISDLMIKTYHSTLENHTYNFTIPANSAVNSSNLVHLTRAYRLDSSIAQIDPGYIYSTEVNDVSLQAFTVCFASGFNNLSQIEPFITDIDGVPLSSFRNFTISQKFSVSAYQPDDLTAVANDACVEYTFNKPSVSEYQIWMYPSIPLFENGDSDMCTVFSNVSGVAVIAAPHVISLPDNFMPYQNLPADGSQGILTLFVSVNHTTGTDDMSPNLFPIKISGTDNGVYLKNENNVSLLRLDVDLNKTLALHILDANITSITLDLKMQLRRNLQTGHISNTFIESFPAISDDAAELDTVFIVSAKNQIYSNATSFDYNNYSFAYYYTDEEYGVFVCNPSNIFRTVTNSSESSMPYCYFSIPKNVHVLYSQEMPITLKPSSVVPNTMTAVESKGSDVAYFAPIVNNFNFNNYSIIYQQTSDPVLSLAEFSVVTYNHTYTWSTYPLQLPTGQSEMAFLIDGNAYSSNQTIEANVYKMYQAQNPGILFSYTTPLFDMDGTSFYSQFIDRAEILPYYVQEEAFVQFAPALIPEDIPFYIASYPASDGKPAGTLMHIYDGIKQLNSSATACAFNLVPCDASMSNASAYLREHFIPLSSDVIKLDVVIKRNEAQNLVNKLFYFRTDNNIVNTYYNEFLSYEEAFQNIVMPTTSLLNSTNLYCPLLQYNEKSTACKGLSYLDVVNEV